MKTPHKLNKTQQKAVKSKRNPIVLQAGAGSGKTRVLIERELHILQTELAVDLSNMVTITFTNKATDEIAQRLQKALLYLCKHSKNNQVREKLQRQVHLCEAAPISTIHEFCITLLRQHGTAIGIPHNFSVRNFKLQLRNIITEHILNRIDEHVFAEIPQHVLLKMVETLLDDAAIRGISLDDNLLQVTFDTPSNNFYNQFKPLLLELCVKAAQEFYALKKQKML